MEQISEAAGNWGQVAASLFAGLAFILTLFQFRHSASDVLEARQTEIYQRLEFESMSVFRFEAENKAVVPQFKTHLAPPDFMGPPSGAAERRAREEAQLCARKYYEITCNLFEIAARLRKKDGYMDPEVFGSWVAWFFDTLCEWGFRAAWADLRENYTTHLRDDVFDVFVAELIRDWDIPHAADPAKDLCMPDETVAALRRRFYERVGLQFKCKEIEKWLDAARPGDLPAHPQAFR